MKFPDQTGNPPKGVAMFCRKCGAQNDDHAVRCVQCGEPMQMAAPPPPLQPPPPPGMAPGMPAGQIPNYLVQAILVTILCCLPFGIPAIVFAAQVNGKVQAGDVQGAMDASKKAKMWCWIAFGCGLGVMLLYILMFVFAGIANNM